MQITSDRLQIANGQAMQEILRATEDEARTSRLMANESQKLAVAMKRDSVAMKTVRLAYSYALLKLILFRLPLSRCSSSPEPHML